MITEEEISHQNNNFFDLSHPTIDILDIVKLREREGQGVDPGRSLKGHL